MQRSRQRHEVAVAPYTGPKRIARNSRVFELFNRPISNVKQIDDMQMHKSRTNFLKFGAVWSHSNSGAFLAWAHGSLADAKAQSDLFLHKDFVYFLDFTDSFVTIGKIFSPQTFGGAEHG